MYPWPSKVHRFVCKSLKVSEKKTFSIFSSFKKERHTKTKVVCLVVGPIRFYPPYTNGLVVHATFFYFLVLNQPETDFNNFFFFVVFCLVNRGVYPPYTLSGQTSKKTFFCMCGFPWTMLNNGSRLNFFLH